MRIPLQLNGKLIGEVDAGALDGVKIEKVVSVGQKLVNLVKVGTHSKDRYTITEFVVSTRKRRR